MIHLPKKTLLTTKIGTQASAEEAGHEWTSQMDEGLYPEEKMRTISQQEQQKKKAYYTSQHTQRA